MANERVIKETIITPQLSIGDREPGVVISNDFELFKSSGNAGIGIITDPSSTATINFNDGSSNVAQIEFDQATEVFTVSINTNPIITTDSGQTTIHGNLNVEGTTTTVNSTTVAIADNIFLLNKDEPGPGVTLGTAGIEIERGSGQDNAGWFFNENEDWWGPTGPAGSLEPGVGVTQTIGNVNQINTTTAGNNLLIDGTGSIKVPTGTTAQRTTTPVPSGGEIRFNTTLGQLEVFDSSVWTQVVVTPGGLSTITSDFVNVSGDTMTGDLSMDTGAQVLGDATAGVSAPAFAFDTNTTTGIYLEATNRVTVSSNGVQVARFAANTNGGHLLQANLDLNSNTLCNVSDPPVGMSGNICVGDREYNDGRYLLLDGGNTIEGNVLPDSNNTRNLGSSGTRFNSIFATTFDGTATAALYSDLAERYHADNQYEPGTVLCFGGEKEVTQTTQTYDTSVAGVVSTAPGFMLNKDAGSDQTHPYIALKGRVPCKVVGPIKKGDLLVSSHIPGHAMSSHQKAIEYSVLGKAIEDFVPTHADDTGVIEIFVV